MQGSIGISEIPVNFTPIKKCFNHNLVRSQNSVSSLWHVCSKSLHFLIEPCYWCLSHLVMHYLFCIKGSQMIFAGTPHSELLEEVECMPSPRLALTLKVSGLGTTREVELPLTNFRSTIFYYVQKLLQLSCNGSVKSDKLRRIWEPTYT